MKTYAILNNEPEMLKIKTRDDEIENFKKQTEKHDHENIIKSLKIVNGYYKKEYKSLNKKKIIMIVSEILFGVVGLGVGSGLTISGLAPVGIMCASSLSFLYSFSTLITNEHFSKLRIRYTKLPDWIILITLLYEKTLGQSMIDKEIAEEKAKELKKIYEHYVDKRSEIIKNTQFKVEDLFGEIINKDNFSQDQIIKPNKFLTKMM